mgnify:FL=1
MLVCLFSGGVPLLVLYYLYRYLPVAGFVLEVFWCYQLLATRSLKDESMKVYDRLKKRDSGRGTLCGVHDRRP